MRTRLRRFWFVMALLAFIPTAVFGMTSTNYQILWDSLNTGGTDFSTSTAYKLGDTIGEHGVGFGDSTNYSVGGGYRLGSREYVVPDPTDGGWDPDITPPSIYNVQASTTSYTTALITWQTNELSDSSVSYGHDETYASGTVSSLLLGYTHEIPLAGLLSCQTYYFRVTSADTYGNAISSGGYTFTMPCELIPPVISNVRAEDVTDSSAMILWDTDTPATSLVEYGLTDAYGEQGTSFSFVMSHMIPVAGLLANTTYHFRVTSADAYGSATSSVDYTFTTLPDTTPPTNVTFTATGRDGAVDLSWTIPPDSDYAGVRIVRREDGFPSGPFDGVLVYEGADTSFTDAAVVNGVTYYYGAYAYDASGNYASGALAAAMPVGPPDSVPPLNGSLFAEPWNGIVTLDWIPPPDADYTGVRVVSRMDGPPSGPFDGELVYAGPATSFRHSGLTNGVTYYYGAYAYDASGNYASGAFASATPLEDFPLPPVPPVPPVAPPSVLPPGVSPPPSGVTTTPPTPGATMTVHLFGSGGTLPLLADASGKIGVRSGSPILVSVPASSMNGTAVIAAFIIEDSTYALRFNSDRNAYEGTAPAPAPGQYGAKGQAVFTDGRVAEEALTILAHPEGYVFERPMFGSPSVPIPDAVVHLFTERAGRWVLWDGSRYGQQNPQRTDQDGTYAFDVPPGQYYAEAEKEGFDTKKTRPTFVDMNVFNETIQLVKQPPPFPAIFSTTTTTTFLPLPLPLPPIGLIVDVVENMGERAIYGIRKLREFLEDTPVIQWANKNIVLPTVLTVTVISAASALSPFSFLAFLQYLFTQPFLLLWRIRRKKFGVVYNALTKRPIDLAIVRLIHAETGRIVRTCVTDTQGRYLFRSGTGTYQLDVSKPNFMFPSAYLHGKRVDAGFADVYTGGRIVVEQAGGLAMNIPLDPVVPEEVPQMILFKKVMRKLQHAIAFSGVLISIVAFFVTSTIPMALFVASQLLIYVLFRRIALPTMPPTWGRVFDLQTKKPVPRAIVRMYDATFDTLLETQVTDARGRYGFLAGKHTCYLTGIAKGYKQKRMNAVDLSKTRDGIVKEHIGLEKEEDGRKREERAVKVVREKRKGGVWKMLFGGKRATVAKAKRDEGAAKNVRKKRIGGKLKKYFARITHFGQ